MVSGPKVINSAGSGVVRCTLIVCAPFRSQRALSATTPRAHQSWPPTRTATDVSAGDRLASPTNPTAGSTVADTDLLVQPPGQAAAVGGLWLCRTRPWRLVAVVVPSLFKVIVQAPRWIKIK